MFNMTKQEIGTFILGGLVGMLIANIASGEWVDVGFITVLLLLMLLRRRLEASV